MNLNRTLIIALIASMTLLSCKTREDIEREKKIEAISSQMKDRQQLSADFVTRIQELESQITNLSGKAEENQYQTQNTINSQIKALTERLTVLEENQRELNKKSEAREQYLNEVLKELKNLTGSKKKSGAKLSAYDSAMSDYKKGRYSSAKTKLEALYAAKKIKGSKRARIIHNLGMVAFIQKDNNAALSYFSTLFTEMPKSGYNKNGLLFLGKTFKRLGQKDEMKQTLNELITRWPKARQVSEAKKLL